MTYAEAIRFLYDLRWFGAKLGLENTFRLAELSGNPQDRLRFIHVAGTNGKGSTCAMLESIYRAAGLRVGLFTSPHLVSFRERIQVDRQLINETEVMCLVEEMRELLQHFPSDHPPTFFEVLTVMALRYFAGQKCDLVIWETGLGGRLDATNIVTPLASVITNVQLDHQQWLGDTLEQIASEKAGIIKPGVPVLTAEEGAASLRVIGETARRLGAPLTAVRGKLAALSRDAATLPLLGDHQRLNAALALATVAALQNRIPVAEAAVQTGLRTVQWPGRLQVVKTATDRTFLLDGAHNLAGAQALRAALKKHFVETTPTLILGVLQDKDWRHICETLALLATRIITVPVSSERSADAIELAAACRAANPAAVVATYPSLSEALDQSKGDSLVVITGSLYLVGEALELLGLSPITGGSERGLNDWGGARSSADAAAPATA